jgi:hypothetical protein
VLLTEPIQNYDATKDLKVEFFRKIFHGKKTLTTLARWAGPKVISYKDDCKARSALCICRHLLDSSCISCGDTLSPVSLNLDLSESRCMASFQIDLLLFSKLKLPAGLDLFLGTGSS